MLQRVQPRLVLAQVLSAAKPNEEMIAYWHDVAGPKWIRLQRELDAQLEGIGRRILEGIQRNETVLDVGCGCGALTLQLARRVGPGGKAHGIDVSAPMLARARQRAGEAALDNVDFVEGDAQTYAFGERSFDALVSRFGVMFFDDPVAAFANLRRALRPGGRIALAAWQAPENNPWAARPLAVAQRYASYEPPPPHTPGPFAFADRERLRAILERGGFGKVRIDALEGEMPIGTRLAPDGAAALLCELGPAARALRGAPPEAIARAVADLTAVLEAEHGQAPVTMGYAAWRITAVRL